MVIRIRKKRRRGERTYHGSHKKRRGKGSRGGRGRAGLHKHKWTYTVKYEPEHFGKGGFVSVKKKRIKEKTINLEELEKLVEELEATGKIKMEEKKIKINLTELGYDKLLGRGKITKPLIVEVKKVSEQAKQKIEKIGGKLILVGK
jgi:large subunit ribosomal protein L15